MNAKAFLRQHEIAMLKIRALEAEIDELYAAAFPGLNMDGMPKGGDPSDKVGKLAAKIADMREDAEYLWQEQQKIRRRIEQVLYGIEDAKQFKVAWGRYVELKDWADIAEDIPCTERTAQRIHGDALETVRELLEKMKEK